MRTLFTLFPFFLPGLIFVLESLRFRKKVDQQKGCMGLAGIEPNGVSNPLTLQLREKEELHVLTKARTIEQQKIKLLNSQIGS